jgi:glutamyl-tRNA reductase
MQLFAFGINHTTAPIALREQVSFSPDQVPRALQQAVEQGSAREAVILSTCNRTEVYCALKEHSAELLAWFARYHGLAPELLARHMYTYSGSLAVRHLLRVACGLDSMVLGEPQILGQLKAAYHTAQQNQAVGALLSKLFQHGFAVAKQVRTDTAIGSSPVSVAFAAVRLAQQIFGKLDNHTALLIGAGETIELAARHLHEKGLTRMIVANRTLERARQLATEFQGYAITLPEIPVHLAEADIVIASTASPNHVLTVEPVKQAIKARRRRPIFMVDIAVPRDIEPAVGELEDVYLYSIDDLNEVIQENLRSRQQAAQQAEEIIETQVSHFIGWQQSLNAVDTIRAIREQAEETRQSVLDKAKRMLRNGKSPQEALEFLAHTLTNKLTHAPCAQVRQAGYNSNHELVNAAHQLFQLPER